VNNITQLAKESPAVEPPVGSAGQRELTGRLVARHALRADQSNAMLQLMTTHFNGIEGPTFFRDLQEKNWVILLEDEAGTLRGFSTLLLYNTMTAGRPLSVVYSGDTIVEPSAWGTSALARTWIRSVMALREHAATELYWLLLTSGYRTYRFLPVFWRSFYPSVDRPSDGQDRLLVNQLAAERFGDSFDPADGVVRFPRPQMLTDGLLAISDAKRLDPHVALFLARNPGYVRGDELVCLTEIDDRNLTPAGRRMMWGRKGG
jgi:hypothetical protein